MKDTVKPRRDDGEKRGRKGGKHRKPGHRRGRRLFEHGELRLLVLSMIADRPRHGYDIIKDIENRFDGLYAPSPGVIYPALTALDEAGWIVVEPDASGRKHARITDEGLAHLDANRETLDTLLGRRLPQGPRGRAPRPIVAAMEDIKQALRDQMRRGAPPPARTEAISDILRQAARDIAALTPLETTEEEGQPMQQIITRHKLDTRRRDLTVRDKVYLTPHMIRVTLEGPELDGFTSLGADDHIKLFFGDEMRDYTPRRYDPDAGALVLDFAVHDAGPATTWAVAAQSGDSLTIGGPRGSAVIAPVFDWYLLIGDETALPAIGRRVEELTDGVQAITLTAIPGQADEQSFETAADHSAYWVHRPVDQAADAAPLLDALRRMTLPEGDGFIWIAAEAQVARALKQYVLSDLGHPPQHLKASGYWVDGAAGKSAKSLD